MESIKGKIEPFLKDNEEKHSGIRISKSKRMKCLENEKVNPNRMKDKKLEMNLNICAYCTKVFISSKFLIKHMCRRHSENIICLHQKLLHDIDPDGNNSASQKDLLNFMSIEFKKLNDKLEFLELSVSNHSEYTNQCQRLLKEVNEKFLLNTETIFEDLLLLKNELSDIKTVVKSSNETKNQWENCIADLQTKLKRVECSIISSATQHQTSNSKEFENKLKEEIKFFLNCNKSKKRKERSNIKLNQSTNDRTIASQEFNPKITTENQPVLGTTSEINQNDYEMTELDNETEALFLKEKLKALGISLQTTKLTSSDFKAKMKLVELEKNLLCKNNSFFSEVRHQLNLNINKKVLSKLHIKPSRYKPHTDKEAKIKNYSSAYLLPSEEDIVPSTSKTSFINYNQSESHPVYKKEIMPSELPYNNVFKNSAATLKLIDCSDRFKKEPLCFESISMQELSPLKSDD